MTYGWFGLYGTTDFPDWCYHWYDPWLLGSMLLGLLLFATLLALLITLCYIVCYKKKDRLLIEELPSGPCQKPKLCGPCQPRMTACSTGGCQPVGRCATPCGIAGQSTFMLQPTRINV